MRELIVLIVISISAVGSLAAQEPGPPALTIPVLLITGENNHDWEYTAPIHAKNLEATGRFDVTTTAEPAVFLAQEDLSQFSVFFLDYNGKRWGEVAETRFLARVEEGAGVVVVHAANNAFPGFVAWEKMVGHCWREGTGHGSFHAFDVEVADRNHPITADLPPMKAHPDELYHRLVHMHGAPHRVLMRAFSDEKTGGSGRYEPMAIILAHGKGRIFHTPLGHVWKGAEATHASVADPQFARLLSRGTEWAATGAVRLPARAEGEAAPAAKPGFRRGRFEDQAVLVASLGDLHAVYSVDTGARLQVSSGVIEWSGEGDEGVCRFAGKPFVSGKDIAPRLQTGSGTAAFRVESAEVAGGKVLIRFKSGDRVLTESLELVGLRPPTLRHGYATESLADGEQVILADGRLRLGPGKEGSSVSLFGLSEGL